MLSKAYWKEKALQNQNSCKKKNAKQQESKALLRYNDLTHFFFILFLYFCSFLFFFPLHNNLRAAFCVSAMLMNSHLVFCLFVVAVHIHTNFFFCTISIRMHAILFDIIIIKYSMDMMEYCRLSIFGQ